MTPTTRIRIIWIFIASLVILAGLAAATPYLINSRLVKNQISSQISSWMGLPVTVRGEPIVTVFPYLTVKLKEVEVGSNLPGEQAPLVSMDVLRAEMYWLPLVLGEFKVRRFSLINPQFSLVRRADGERSWDLEHGTLLAPKGQGTGLSLSDISLGRFAISGGKARYADEISGRDEVFDDINLSVIWPSTGRAASVEGKFTWREEDIALEANSDRPMELITGGLSPLNLAIQSDRFSAQLDGTAATLSDLQLEGDFSFETQSLRKMLTWLGFELAPGENLGAASISGRANMVGASASFSEMALKLDDNQADGVLQLDFRRERGLVQGTLAYDQLNLSPYLSRLEGGPSVLERSLSPKDLGRMDIDVRLSANSLSLGAVTLGRTAASLVTRNQQLSLSIGEAFAYGGRLEASLEMRPSKTQTDHLVTVMRAKANGISAGTFAREISREPYVTGTALAEIDIQGEGRTLQETIRNAAGDLSMVITEGSMSHFNLEVMLDALQAGTDVEPDAIYEGGTRFDVLSVRGQVGENKIELGGLRLTAGNLALAGSAALSVDNFELDFPGTLAQYRSADPGTHSSEAPEAEYPFRLAGPLTQPILTQGNEQPQSGDKGNGNGVSVPGVPDMAEDMEKELTKPQQETYATSGADKAAQPTQDLKPDNAISVNGPSDADTAPQSSAQPANGEVDLQSMGKSFGDAADEIIKQQGGALGSDRGLVPVLPTQ